MKKKATKKIILAALVIFLQLPPGSVRAEVGYENYPPDIRRIKERGMLVVAVYAKDIPPFFMHDAQGRFYGLDVKIARDIAGELGVDVGFNREAETFDEIIEIVARGEADVAISWLSRTLDRAQMVRFTRPYITLHQGLLINRRQLSRLPDRKNILKSLNHAGGNIGVKEGTAYVDYAEKLFPEANIRLYPDWDPYIVDAVFEGKLDAGYHDEIEIKKYLLKRPEASIRASTAIIQDLTDPIAMAVAWDSSTLLEWLNIYIEDQMEEWDADKLLHEYRESLVGNGD